MIKYIIVENTSSLFKFDTETESVDSLNVEREAIRSITLIDEPGILVDGDNETPVESGDLVIRFYERYFDKNTIVVKSKDWKNNLNAYNKKIEEDRKKNELKKAAEAGLCESCYCCEAAA